MARIHRLPAHLVNKIAAGEVIERPASVVKELVENALDAGATRIDVTCGEGGTKLIRVADDGAGMDEEDLRLAFAPHATSKLLGEEQLFAIRTMGFRGEALASIASVSRAHIRTRRRPAEGEAENPSGYEASAAGEDVQAPRPCAAPPGSTVTVRDLFFNTPARRKFLRAASTEIGHISEQIARLALPNPAVAFTLTHNERTTLKLPAAGTTLQRARDLLGGELADSLIPLSARQGPVGVAGLIAPPAAARSSTKWQYVFLNGRYIRDRLISHALREAYRGLIDPSRSPVALIFLEIDPAEVDVNVHPTKIEVRFREGNLVHGELLAALRETLNRANLTPGASLERALSDDDRKDDTANASQRKRREGLERALADFFESSAARTARSAPAEASPSPGASPREPASPGPSAASGPLHSGPAPARPLAETEPAPTARLEMPAPPQSDPPASPPARRPGEPVQIHDSYILVEDADGLTIVDQHALHERILYNRFRERLTRGKLESQRMLIPQGLRIGGGEEALLDEHAELLERLGIEVAPFGPQTVAVQRFPALLVGRGVEPAAFLRDLLDELAGEDAPDTAEAALESVLAMMACKAAVKAGAPLSTEEMRDLLASREELEKGSSCPHGRPTTIHLSLAELARQFKRT
jgi:DNA mismatch repair protein MutL